MLLMPAQNWLWYYEKEHDRFALALGEEMVFLTPYSDKQLTPDCHFDTAFSTEHADFYQRALSRLQGELDLMDAVLVQIALNITAARFFALPRMPKSWHFAPSDQIVYACEGKRVSLQSPSGHHQFVVVEALEQSTLVMLLDPLCALTGGREMRQFDLIKVMNDRLAPASEGRHVRIVAA
ncbi:cell division protein ZapC [Ferrimonas gelatinilytica]|uniref:Cell division protein ZapC n=1 Tax=Ferrimonas gelatinilytica TaxID=1255257 RepID=A0ABP9RW37_9GAMM